MHKNIQGCVAASSRRWQMSLKLTLMGEHSRREPDIWCMDMVFILRKRVWMKIKVQNISFPFRATSEPFKRTQRNLKGNVICLENLCFIFYIYKHGKRKKNK